MKSGLDWFRIDTNFDDKFELVCAEFGSAAFEVIVRLWQKIYANEGYYTEWNEEVALLFAKKHSLGGNVVSEIVKCCIKRKLFDEKMFENFNILTSKGIQTWYLNSTERRNNIKLVNDYLLIDVPQNRANVNIIGNNVCKTAENVSKNTHSKVKESKEEDKICNVEGKPTTACFKEVVEYLNLKVGANYKYTTDKNKRLIQARYNEGFKLEDFKKVIDVKAKEWLSGDMAKYLRPETLFGTKFEGYLNACAKKNNSKYGDGSSYDDL